MDKEKIICLRMERQFLTRKANEAEYIQLYRDLQPGQNVYWNGFGDPPSLSFRADFNDIEFNRQRQAKRELVKGRFAGGNLGWIEAADIELFACLYRKNGGMRASRPTDIEVLELIEREGPLNIQQIKEITGMLVKEITPVLHRLQEAFLIYEDQYDGEWDRGWYRFSEMFPNVDFDRYTKTDALEIVLKRFAYRNVFFNADMTKSFYKLPAKDIKTAISELLSDGELVEHEDGFLLKSDYDLLNSGEEALRGSLSEHACVFALHRNDFLYKSDELMLKEKFKPLYENLAYDHEPLQYLLIDGEFHGASVGHFRNGPYNLNDVVCDLPNADEYRDEIIEAIIAVNYGNSPARFMGKDI